MKDLLLYIARNLVDDPDSVSVTEVQLKNTTTPMSWCGALNTLDGWSSIKSSMIELFEGKYATGADYCAYLDTLCG